MTELTLETVADWDEVRLLETLAEALAHAAEGLRRACVCAVALEAREAELPMLPQVFRFAREIAEGRLSPQAAWVITGLPRKVSAGAVRALCALPHAEQERIAGGGPIKIAVRDKDGRIRFEDRQIWTLTQAQLALAFGEDGLTPPEEQGEFLVRTGRGAEVTPAPELRVWVDAETGEIVVNRPRFRPEDLRAAYAATGWQIKPIYGSAGVRPVKVRG